MLTMTVWQACWPVLALLATGAAVAALVYFRRRRRDAEKKDDGLPEDVLADLFRDTED